MPEPQREPYALPVTVFGGDGMKPRCAPTGVGGNLTLINQNEASILKRTVEEVPVEYAPAGYDEPGRHA